MLTFHRTSILTSQAQTVVNTVNTVGVMGKGLASAFKARYPEMFREYRKLCQEHRFDIGQLWLWKAPDQWVLNFPTKRHWRNPSQLSYIEAGLEKFVAQYEQRGIRDIAFPRLGCGNGGLDWEDVRPLMEKYLSKLPIPVYVHDFEVDIGAPEHRERKEPEQFKRSFNTFIEHLNVALHREKGQFYTLHNRTPFKARLDQLGNLVIDRAGHRRVIPNNVIFELWTLLLSGPLTRRRLPGPAHKEAYYLFPILASLPYIRPIQVGEFDDDFTSAVELLDNELSTQQINDAENPNEQGQFEWA